MQAERDLLVRFVFPELRERCARRRLHVIDVDLRWGVTEQESQHGGKLEVCLDEIERCRPFFVGLLGERYGWIPPSYSVPEGPGYEWVDRIEPGHSITALEIYHGVLRDPAIQARAIFYYRDPAYVAQLPVDQRVGYEAESPEAADKLAKLKAEVRAHCPVRDYSAPDQAFERMVLEDLWAAIDRSYPDQAAVEDSLAIERSFHEAFLEARARLFLGRSDTIQALNAYVGGNRLTPLVITGGPGAGGSALMAALARSLPSEGSDQWVLSHFVGISPESSRVNHTVRRLWHEIAERFSLQGQPPDDGQKLPDKCTRTSSTASERFSLMYRTRTPFEFHRPPTRRAPSPSYAG
jgi:hypothetical protein